MRFGVEFSLEIRIFRTAGAGAARTSRVRHKAFDHPMENDAVVKVLSDELLDMGDVAGCAIGPHFDDDRSLRRFKRECITGFDLGHRKLLLWDLRSAIAEAGGKVNLAAGLALCGRAVRLA